MDYKQVIEESWEFAQNNRAIMFIYAFIPAIINATFSIGFISYQFLSLRNSPELGFSEESFIEQSFHFGQQFIEQHPTMLVPVGVAAVVYYLAHAFIPVLSKGAIIQLAARIRNKQKPKLISGVAYGLRSFLPLFGFSVFLNIFSLGTIISYFLLVLRNFGVETAKFFFPIFVILFFVGLIMNFLFAFAETFIVIDDKSIDDSIWASSSLVVRNWAETMLVLILVGLIALRIILNMVILFLIPFLASIAISFFATINLANIGYIITTLVVLFTIYIIGYIGGTFTLFSNSVWTFAFLDLTNQNNLSARSKG